MTEPEPTPTTPETDFPDTWDDAPERPDAGPEPLGPSDPAPAIPSQPPL